MRMCVQVAMPLLLLTEIISTNDAHAKNFNMVLVYNKAKDVNVFVNHPLG